MIHVQLPITDYRPEEMRVCQVKPTAYHVETYNPSLEKWISQKVWDSLGDAILDAINWYPVN